ncbi:hypothetical protein BG006_004544 [Podila minutissima]|uniref:Pseudouridine synthase RsuA/RluA-like domain-containing protein n=1 Tax=Podila minutissima TaxID=64525 RepID=A0A9P5SL78_9FUNG|nr:hypothetical protein BG006_004544 [Podila minutissima]
MTHSTCNESSIPIPAAGQSRTEETIPSSSAVQDTTLQSTEATLEATATEEEPTHTESVVHLGSKRHPESKHGHYVNSQPPKKQKKRVDLVKPEDDLLNAEYYFDNGKSQTTDRSLRKIKPYFFKYQTYAKGRWLGRQLIEVFNTEFRDRDNTFYERAISDGRIKVNGQIVAQDYIVQNSDIVAHDIHRHEPPVAHLPVKIVRQDNGVIIVDKPSSVPVHPSGRYRHNTVLHILMKEQGFKELYPVNRLDRLTSGLMIIALSVRKAREFEQMMQKCEINKEYVCKVVGRFPSGITECHEPIHVASFKLTLNTVHPDGKACSTIFELARYDPATDTSIVYARPVTGRTHQIRVHLQWLGFPITNDPLYCNKEIWGLKNGQGGITEEMEKDLVERLTAKAEQDDEYDFAAATSAAKEVDQVEGEKVVKGGEEGAGCHAHVAEFCKICGMPSRADPEPEKRVMFLHAWKYRAKDWAFETDLPDWAKEGGVVEKDVMQDGGCAPVSVESGDAGVGN